MTAMTAMTDRTQISARSTNSSITTAMITRAFSTGRDDKNNFESEKKISHNENQSGEDSETVSESDVFIKQWALSFVPSSIPIEKLKQSFSRSSGPGGQNVNKVNSKVEIRFELSNSHWIPNRIKNILMIREANRINKNGEFIITSDRHRTQKQNIDDCVHKLYECIMNAVDIPNETDPSKTIKIENMKSAQRVHRRREKETNSKKKADRSKNNWD